MNHTPGPWAHDHMTKHPGLFRILDKNREVVANVECVTTFSDDVYKAEEIAEHIVHCVNTHDALVEALQQILKHAPQAEPESETYDDTESAYSNGYDNACWELALIARKALALTEKGTS